MQRVPHSGPLALNEFCTGTIFKSFPALFSLKSLTEIIMTGTEHRMTLIPSIGCVNPLCSPLAFANKMLKVLVKLSGFKLCLRNW